MNWKRTISIIVTGSVNASLFSPPLSLQSLGLLCVASLRHAKNSLKVLKALLVTDCSPQIPFLLQSD